MTNDYNRETGKAFGLDHLEEKDEELIRRINARDRI